MTVEVTPEMIEAVRVHQENIAEEKRRRWREERAKRQRAFEEKIRAKYLPQAQQIVPGLTIEQFTDLEDLFYSEHYELDK
jgi:hypothetical protein